MRFLTSAGTRKAFCLFALVTIWTALSGGGSAVSAAPTSNEPEEAFAREAITSLFIGDRKSLAELYQQQLTAEAQARDARPLKPSDVVLYLFNSSNRNRDQFLLGMELAATEARSEDLRTRILLALLSDEYYELNQLKGQNTFNKFTRVFNRASSSLSKLALFQPQDAAQLLLDGAYSMRKARTPTDRERQIVYLAATFLKKYPDAPENLEVREFMTQLQARLNTDWALREKLAGSLAMERGDFDWAEFHLEKSSIINAQDEETIRLLADAKAQRKEQRANRVICLSVSESEKSFTDDENKALRELTTALLFNEPDKLENAARNHPEMAEWASYAATSLEERDGHHEAAVARLSILAAQKPEDPAVIAAGGVLANPDYNLDQRFDQTVAEMKENQKKFILWGTRDRDEKAYAYGSAAVQSAGQAASGLPMLFFTDVIVRGVAERFRTQVQVDDVLDAGARFIRRYPDSQRSKEIAGLVSQLSFKAGDYERSGRYLDESGKEDPARRKKLRENEARGMVEKAMAADNLAERKLRLEEVVADYSDAKIVDKARKELDKLQPTLGERSIVLTRKSLMRDPELVVMLGIHPAVVDGTRGNGEMTDQGIALDVEKKNFSFRTRGSSDYITAELPAKESTAIIARAVALWKSEEARQGGNAALRRQVVPLAVEGGAGGGGIEVAPKIIPFRDNVRGSRYFKE